MSKHHPPPTIDTDPEPVTRDESLPAAVLDPEPSEFAAAPSPVRTHAETIAASDLTAELGALPASNDLAAIQANAGAGYYADKHDALLADLRALTFDDAAATAQRDALVTRLSAG